jgi:hypothetical protein
MYGESRVGIIGSQVTIIIDSRDLGGKRHPSSGFVKHKALLKNTCGTTYTPVMSF